MANDNAQEVQLRRDLVRIHNQLEALLEEAHIKLSSWSPICLASVPDAC